MSSKSRHILIWIFSTLSFMIPKAFKRLVVISTLYAKGAEEKLFIHADYAKLNKNMNIASSFDAIQSALCLQGLIWRDVDLNQIMVEASKNEFNGEMIPGRLALTPITEKIVDSLPDWIRYNRAEMLEDIRHLLSAEPIAMHS